MRKEKRISKLLYVVTIFALVILSLFGGTFIVKKTAHEFSIQMNTGGASDLIRAIKE